MVSFLFFSFYDGRLRSIKEVCKQVFRKMQAWVLGTLMVMYMHGAWCMAHEG